MRELTRLAPVRRRALIIVACGLVLAGYMKVLGPAVGGRFPIVNTHPSLLPRYRGPNPIAWTVRNGDRELG